MRSWNVNNYFLSHLVDSCEVHSSTPKKYIGYKFNTRNCKAKNTDTNSRRSLQLTNFVSNSNFLFQFFSSDVDEREKVRSFR